MSKTSRKERREVATEILAAVITGRALGPRRSRKAITEAVEIADELLAEVARTEPKNEDSTAVGPISEFIE